MKRFLRSVARPFGPLVLIIAVTLALLPIGLLAMNSFKPHIDIVSDPVAPPSHLYLHNFTAAWSQGHFARGLINSLLLCGSTVLIVICTASMAAYSLARGEARIWRLIGLYFLCAITVPIQLFLFPLYFIFAKLHLLGNVFATSVILSAVNLPLAVLLLRTYVLGIPSALEDAAVLDGASPFQIFRLVVFPLMRPGLVTVAAITCLAVWNEYLITSTFQQGEQHFTMTLAYLAMNGSISDDQGILMAGGLIVVVPILLIFLATRRFIIDGMTTGAVKG